MSYHHYIFLVLSKGGNSLEDHIFSAEAKISQPRAPGMSQMSSARVVARIQVGQPRDWGFIPCRGKRLALGTIQPQCPMSRSWSLLHSPLCLHSVVLRQTKGQLYLFLLLQIYSSSCSFFKARMGYGLGNISTYYYYVQVSLIMVLLVIHSWSVIFLMYSTNEPHTST